MRQARHGSVSYTHLSTDINLPYVTSENRLYKSVKAQIIDNSTVKIIFDYKEKYHIFGYEMCIRDSVNTLYNYI